MSTLPSIEADILSDTLSCAACLSTRRRKRRTWLGPALRLDVSLTGNPHGAFLVLEEKRSGKEIDRALQQAGEDHAHVNVPFSILEESGPPGPTVLIRVCGRGLVGTFTLGTAIVTIGDLVAHPFSTLLVQNSSGLPIYTGSTPPVPCEVHLTVAPDTVPPSWPSPAPPSFEARTFPRHVFLMTRGTRGDVQPFVALAVGMAAKHGWLVTLCTELHWRDFVLQHAADVPEDAGVVRFLPCGGDTELETSSWLYQRAMNTRSDAMQTLMMSASEWNFFPSAAVLAHQLAREQASGRPPDLLVCSFTLVGVALLLSERSGVPMAGFLAQAAAIPSADPLADQRLFGDQTARRIVKTVFEGVSFGHVNLTIPMLRRQLGLPDVPAERSPRRPVAESQTWPTVFGQQLPMILPMHPSTFAKPADWGSHIQLTDFIFLRRPGSDVVSPTKRPLAGPIEAFVKSARKAGRKVMAMTFSSMAVPRHRMLQVATKLLTETRHPVSLVYIGKRQPGKVGPALAASVDQLTAAGQFLEVESADFGALFPRLDASIVHGGLGTTVEALRTRKPVAVTGILLMDQRFWGDVVYNLGVGPPPLHVDKFVHTCVAFADQALDPESAYAKAARALSMGEPGDDGIDTNLDAFNVLLKAGLEPVHV